LAVYCAFALLGVIAKKKLNENLRPGSKTFSELFRCAALLLFENAIEVGDIVEPAVIRNFGNGMRSINEFSRSMTQPDLIQRVDKCISCSLFDKATKGYFSHINQLCHFTQCYRPVKIDVHVLKSLFNPSTV
jgi:hypothetical protein